MTGLRSLVVSLWRLIVIRYAYASATSFIVVATILLTVLALADDDVQPQIPLTIAYTFLASYGCLTTAWTVYDSNTERRGIKRRRHSDRILMAIATANVRREVIRVLVFGCIVVIGVAALVGGLNPRISRSLLVLQMILLLANSVFDRVERAQTDLMLKKLTEAKEPDAG